MDYAHFCRLLQGKEKPQVDFKLRCSTFLSKAIGDRAELAKDICAMANNGNVASYIVIGVSDDGKSFESVANPKLTDDNIQAFCKKALSPHPHIEVHRERWSDGAPEHADKDFVIIQVGPHSRRAFHLADDFIDYTSRVCYRRNEVWVRRGSTNDIATPEEIVNLVKGKEPLTQGPPRESIEYGKLSLSQRMPTLAVDFDALVVEQGGAVYGDRFVFRIGQRRYVWRRVIVEECNARHPAYQEILRAWQYEHGVLLLAQGAITKGAIPSGLENHFREQWGHFLEFPVNPHRRLLSPAYELVPAQAGQFTISAMAVPGLSSTAALRRSLLGAFEALRTPPYQTLITFAREEMNRNLRAWLKQGWLLSTNTCYLGGGKRNLAPGLVVRDGMGYKRLSGPLLDRLVASAEHVLALSSGRARSS